MIRSGKYVKATFADFPDATANKGALAQALDTGALYHSDGTSWNVLGTINSSGYLLDGDGGVYALSEAVAVVTLTATDTAVSGACEFRGFVVRSESGGTADVTIYDATSATGTAIMTVANITTGTYYWDGDHATAGVGTGGRRINSTGCHVVISGTATIDVMVE
jgi:hypothetical protein